MLKPIEIDASQFVKRYYSMARFAVNMEDFIACNLFSARLSHRLSFSEIPSHYFLGETRCK